MQVLNPKYKHEIFPYVPQANIDQGVLNALTESRASSPISFEMAYRYDLLSFSSLFQIKSGKIKNKNEMEVKRFSLAYFARIIDSNNEIMFYVIGDKERKEEKFTYYKTPLSYSYDEWNETIRYIYKVILNAKIVRWTKKPNASNRLGLREDTPTELATFTSDNVLSGTNGKWIIPTYAFQVTKNGIPSKVLRSCISFTTLKDMFYTTPYVIEFGLTGNKRRDPLLNIDLAVQFEYHHNFSLGQNHKIVMMQIVKNRSGNIRRPAVQSASDLTMKNLITSSNSQGQYMVLPYIHERDIEMRVPYAEDSYSEIWSLDTNKTNRLPFYYIENRVGLKFPKDTDGKVGDIRFGKNEVLQDWIPWLKSGIPWFESEPKMPSSAPGREDPYGHMEYAMLHDNPTVWAPHIIFSDYVPQDGLLYEKFEKIRKNGWGTRFSTTNDHKQYYKLYERLYYQLYEEWITQFETVAVLLKSGSNVIIPLDVITWGFKKERGMHPLKWIPPQTKRQPSPIFYRLIRKWNESINKNGQPKYYKKRKKIIMNNTCLDILCPN